MPSTSRRPRDDYESPRAWALFPGAPKPGDPSVDVFFVHPTTFDGGRDWNGPIGARSAAHILDRVMLPNYAAPFAAAGRVFVPRYRQASLYSALTLFDDAIRGPGVPLWRRPRRLPRLPAKDRPQPSLRRRGCRTGRHAGRAPTSRRDRSQRTGASASRRRLSDRGRHACRPIRRRSGTSRMRIARPRRVRCRLDLRPPTGLRAERADHEPQPGLERQGAADRIKRAAAAVCEPALGRGKRCPSAHAAQPRRRERYRPGMGRAPRLHGEPGRRSMRGRHPPGHPDRALRCYVPSESWAERLRVPSYDLFWADLEADAQRRVAVRLAEHSRGSDASR